MAPWPRRQSQLRPKISPKSRWTWRDGNGNPIPLDLLCDCCVFEQLRKGDWGRRRPVECRKATGAYLCRRTMGQSQRCPSLGAVSPTARRPGGRASPLIPSTAPFLRLLQFYVCSAHALPLQSLHFPTFHRDNCSTSRRSETNNRVHSRSSEINNGFR